MRIRNRFISLLLCLSMLFSLIAQSAPAAMAAEKSVVITCDGQKIDSLTIERNKKETVQAVVDGMAVSSYQWQILLDAQAAVWVDIYDKTGAECEVSYALVKNMLNEADCAYLRCEVTGANETVYSNEICVKVTPESAFVPAAVFSAQPQHAQAPKTVSSPAVYAGARDGITEYVTITIKYLDAASLDGGEETAIYSPYTATIEKNTSFKQNVISPTFLGFAPYLDSNGNQMIDDGDQSAATLLLDYASVTENIEINVYYTPIEVNFAVKYFFQNINDDLYTENPARYHTSKAETGTIVANEYLETHAGDTTGFTKMYHIPESVAADGSTVFECYYDRSYFLIQFDLNGGYGVDPIYARYGTPFVVNDPIRHGYRFNGWKLTCIDLNGNGEWDDALPDDAPDELVSTIPAHNHYYQAQWITIDTTYTVVYWLSAGNGKYDYIGSRIVEEKSGVTVSGENDIAGADVCGYAPHTHGDDCYGNCDEEVHVCSITCYTDNTLNLASSQTGTIATVYNKLRGQVESAVEGNLYKYAYRTNNTTSYYNFFYYGGTWYYLGTGTDYDGIALAGTLSTPSRNNYNTVAATKGCGGGAHTHDDACLSCTLEEHTHDTGCKVDSSYYVFEKADQNVLVDGDGSSVVNVYYKPKEYTLRFYYAATTGSGTDTDADGVADTYTTVKIIGGTSYYFGSWGTNTSDDVTLLNNVFGSDGVGTVTKLPQLNAEGKSRDYTLGSITSGTNTYHYIEFTAGFGTNIADLWPCSVFESATRTSISNNTNGWTGTEAFVSAWNGEHHVWYSQNVGNQTIKGKYEQLDYKLIFSPNFTDETTVSYLCFWENGAGGVNWNVPRLFVYRIWVPVFADELASSSATTTLDGLPVTTYNGVKYKLIDSYDTCDDSNLGGQTQPGLAGYTEVAKTESTLTLTAEQQKYYKTGSYINFFYARDKAAFAMKNYGEYLVNIKVNKDGTGGVPYQTKLATLPQVDDALDADYVPPYPSTLEENAYHFEGWYMTEQCLPGTKVELSTATMPSAGLILYANWVPETHTVRFFTTYGDLTAYEQNSTGTVYHTATAKHGETIGTVPVPDYNGAGGLDLIFAGWFYMEAGQKRAFAPLNMPVNSDMSIFAEWSSHSPQPYKISYVLQSNPNTHVAEDTTGFAYGGTTRTFNAKAGEPYNQLYDAYNHGYFPTVSSHSITIQAEADHNHPVNNVFTFYYVYAENISYTIRYVNKETNVVMDVVEATTTSAVITERFRAYPDMVPDAFYKRLVLEVEWSEEEQKYVGTDNNVITFYYTPNSTSAYYAVHFMLEKPNATDAEKANYDINGNGGYEETGTHIEGVGKIGSTVYITPQNMSGFGLIDNAQVPIVLADGGNSKATYSGANSGYGIAITHSGTELYLFYERNDYPYIVYYYEYNTTNSLQDPKEGQEDYDETVTETAVAIPGYTCVSKQTQTITIREDDGSEGLNVIIFYYAPLQYVAEYVAVPEDGGWLSSTIEVITGVETLGGSMPNTNPHYEFVGWYLDEACTQSAADYGTIDPLTNRFTPQKAKLSETERNIFYAKFNKKAGDFTVDRNDAQDETQVFVYEIRNNSTNDTYCVTVTGNESVTIKNLPLGEYTVTQQNDWSWRYGDSPIVVNHQQPSGTTAVFRDAEQDGQWLNGNSAPVKNRRG